MRRFTFVILLLFPFLLINSLIFAQSSEFYVAVQSASFKLPVGFTISQELIFSKELKKTTESIRLFRLTSTFSGKTQDIVQQLESLDAVIWAEEVIHYETLDATTSLPNDPDRNSLQLWLQTIRAEQAWNIGTGSSDVVIAVIDTGTELTHEDLSANLWVNSDEIPGNGIDDDTNGFVDDVNGWDFFEQNGNPSPKSASNNHGTHVAGLAAAVTNNGKGIASVSHNTRFMPLKISNNFGKSLAYGVESIIYAVDNGASVINCSWGSTRYSKALETAINYAWNNGVIIVAAAGNDGTQAVYYPAGYPNVIAVASVGFRDVVKSPYSNYGGFVDVVSIGGDATEGIYSTLNNNSYGVSFGTSMASPIVASSVGLIRSIRKFWDVATVRAQLETSGLSVQTANNGIPYLLGSGLIQVDKALSETLRPLAKLQSFHFGNPDAVSAVFNRGDNISLYLNLKNIGISQNDIKISVFPIHDVVTVSSGNSVSYSVNHDASWSANPIFLRVRDDVPVNTTALIRIELTYSDNSTSNEVIQIQLVPDHIIHSANTIEIGVNGTGRIGFFSYPNTTEGSGFVIKQSGTTQTGLVNVPLLREAGLSFGAGDSRISSSVRGAGTSVNDEFYLIDYFQSEFNDARGYQKGMASFTDLNAGIEAIRFDMVTQLESYAQTAEEDAQYILLKYTLENASNQTYPKIRAGLFFDFDMPFTTNTDDVVFYDVENDFVAQFSGGTESDTTLYIGASIVEGIYTPWLINNNEADGNTFFGTQSTNGGNGFTDAEKWRSMDLRSASAANFASRRRIGPANVSFMISPDQFSFEPNEMHSFTVILGYGVGYDELKKTMQRAKSRAALVTSIGSENPIAEKPEQLRINGAYPNPFNPQTTISYYSANRSSILLHVYDILGKQMYSKVISPASTGNASVSLDASNWSSGTYFVRLVQDNQSAFLPITLVK